MYALIELITIFLLLIFKGTDSKGRMVEMILNNPVTPSDQEKKPNISLRLSYIEDPLNLDIYKIAPDDF